MAAKTHWKNLTNANYLGAYSFDNADEVTVTISSVGKETVKNPSGASEDCIVVHFQETEVDGVTIKPMIFNKTNCEKLEKLYSKYIEDWVGKRITIFKTTTQFGRDIVECLRIKDEVPFKAQVKQIQYTCSICGKPISEKYHNAAIAKYGVDVCSAECAQKIESKKEEE